MTLPMDRTLHCKERGDVSWVALLAVASPQPFHTAGSALWAVTCGNTDGYYEESIGSYTRIYLNIDVILPVTKATKGNASNLLMLSKTLDTCIDSVDVRC